MSTALHTLLEHAERQRDAAQAALAQAQAHGARLAQQASQLQAYQHEYQQRHPAQGGRSATMALLHYHDGFMQRLAQALAQQQAQVRAAEKRVLPLQQVLLGHEMRVAGIQKLLQRRSQSQQQQAARRDQKQTDEAAQRRRPGSAESPAAGWRLGSDLMPLNP